MLLFPLELAWVWSELPHRKNKNRKEYGRWEVELKWFPRKEVIENKAEK